MLIEQLRNEEYFTNHEKDVAHFILDNIDEVSNMTSEQLAEYGGQNAPVLRTLAPHSAELNSNSARTAPLYYMSL